MIEEAAAVLTNRKESVFVRAIKLFEFQCWVFGGAGRFGLSRAGKAIATLAVLEELRKSRADDRKEVETILRSCFSDP